MDRCLKERDLLRMYMQEGTAAERLHLRLCADCAEHYDALVEDLEAIGHALATPPPLAARERSPWRTRWMPAAAACAALIAIVLGVTRLQRPAPVRVAATTGNVSAFAADLSDALFATTDANAAAQQVAEAPYLEAALEAGQPCTQARFLNGECTDELSAFLSEDE